MEHLWEDAPLITRVLMAHDTEVRYCYLVVAHLFHSAPLVTILAIAVFLVVIDHSGRLLFSEQ